MSSSSKALPMLVPAAREDTSAKEGWEPVKTAQVAEFTEHVVIPAKLAAAVAAQSEQAAEGELLKR